MRERDFLTQLSGHDDYTTHVLPAMVILGLAAQTYSRADKGARARPCQLCPDAISRDSEGLLDSSGVLAFTSYSQSERVLMEFPSTPLLMAAISSADLP